MAPSGFAVFLLFLGLVVSNAYGNTSNTTAIPTTINTTTVCDNILNAFNNANNSDFNLTVSPTTLSSKTEYTVTLDGHSNFTELLFQAVSQDNQEGTWPQASSTCNGSGLFTGPFQNNTHFQTTWLSPDNVTSVTIYAYIHNGTYTFRLHQTLSQALNNTTTKAPTTAGNQTSGAVTVSTHSTQTTAAGSIQQFSLVSMALSVILGLLLIPNKYLA